MKNLINFFIQLFKSEWRKPKELCLLNSVFLNRLWMTVPIIYVVFIVVNSYFGQNPTKLSSVISNVSGSLFVVFTYLWAMISSFIMNEKQKAKNAGFATEEIKHIIKIPVLLYKISLIIVLVSLIFMVPIAIIIALRGH